MATELAEQASTTLRATPGKYLTFSLGRESYGIAVLKVREIILETVMG